MPVPFDVDELYRHNDGHISCLAFGAQFPDVCEAWLQNDVTARVYDKPTIDDFNDDMTALSVDGFDITILQAIQDEPQSEVTYGDIGESIADLFLIERHRAYLPSNRRRDLRNPNASQAGADIAGYVEQDDGSFCFLFGEVKASSEMKNPPSVMTHTDSGMVVQLKHIFTSLAYRRTLMFYLRNRSQDAVNQPMYRSALENLSEGKYCLVGVLVRDTIPSQGDVARPMSTLRASLPAEQQCHIYVLHTCLSTSDWLLHCKVA